MSELSPAVTRPSHVDEAAVYDFDMFADPTLLSDPHERVREILAVAPPVFWTPRNGGHWVAVGHDEVYSLSRDTQAFTNVLLPPALGKTMSERLPPEIPI